jgi:hypothetical protein
MSDTSKALNEAVAAAGEGKDPVNLDDMTVDQIRELAQKELAGQLTEEIGVLPRQPQPRDEKGKFAKPDEEADEPEEAEEEEEQPDKVWRQEIDLGDGSGVQVFEGDTPEELIAALAKAQRNATMKIREQAEKLRQQQQKPADKLPEVTPAQEIVYSQELMQKPTKAFAKMFKDMTGVEISEFRTVKARVDAWEQAKQAEAQQKQVDAEQNKATAAFMAAHPEFIANPVNGQKMIDRVELLEARAIKEGKSLNYATLLENAYSDLSKDGLLELREQEVNGADAPEDAGKPRIVAPEEPAKKQRAVQRKASGLSARARSAAPVKSSEPTEDELYQMPLEKLKELANQSLR